MLRFRLRHLETILHHLQARAKRQPPVPPCRLQSTADLLALLREQMEAVRADPTLRSGERARAVGYLVDQARKALETGTLAERLEILEAVLQTRKGREDA